MSNIDVLPDSRLTTIATPKGSQLRNGSWWQPVFCANCGADGGRVPEENMDFAFYLCNPCNAKYGEIAGTYAEPDAKFFARVHETQMEQYGRVLTPAELVIALDDVNNPLSRLGRERRSIISTGV